MTEALTGGTAWLAMAALVASLALRIRTTGLMPANGRAVRWMWTLGAVLLWVHVGCAFQFQHHWSHTAAYAHTASQTQATTGIAWGGGLFFNYALMLAWTGDAAWWWIAPGSYRRRPAVATWLMWGFVLFMAFNATVVFGSGAARWIALATFVGLAVLYRRQNAAAGPPPKPLGEAG